MTECRIVDVGGHDTDLIERLAELSCDAFRSHAPTWLPTVEDARTEVMESLEAGRRSRALINAVFLKDRTVQISTCYNIPAHKLGTDRNAAYAEQLATLVLELGFPPAYASQIVGRGDPGQAAAPGGAGWRMVLRSVES